jgi:N-acetylmuramoyl-L-alanine amidase
VESVKEEQKKVLVKSVDLIYKKNTDGQTYNAIFNITLDTIYVYNIYENDTYIYIDFLKPHDVYNKIIVIDAGHGGDDVGTYTSEMKYFEKNINLDIVLELKKLLDKDNSIKVYYTRTTDKKVYLNPRINIANNLKADYFISVHCNSNNDSRPNGTEVLYKKSKKFATVCLNNLVNETGAKSLGIVKDNNIHIFKKSKVPIALIEVAFMSNNKDLNYLIKEKNQKKVAQGIYNAINSMYKNENKGN